MSNAELVLYYAPGACSMASHIALEEAGAKFRPHPIRFANNEQSAPHYLAINPRGRVPALKLEDGTVIVENLAIQYYIARRFADAGLFPDDLARQTRCLSLMAWFSNTVHPSFSHIVRAARFASSQPALDEVQTMGRASFWANVAEIDQIIGAREWIAGDTFTVCDGYALVFYAWGRRVDMPMAELKNYTAWTVRVMARPAVRRVLEREDSLLLKAAA